MAIDTRKILHTAFNKHTKNVDNYNHNGSTWLIFTDKKKWVIELTKEGTLWYNYYFFQNIMKLLSLEVVENQHYITEWVENFIQNGVKETYSDKIPHEYDWSNQFTEEIDDIIQNGVKHTEKSLQIDGSCVIEDVITEGVKHTEYGDWLDGDERLNDIIENGIKETWGYEKQPQKRIDEVIMNGQKD